MIFAGKGSPEGQVTAIKGALYQQVDGVDGALLWQKRSDAGESGWTQLVLSGRQVFDVRDFGAVGDGSTDDTAAIQAAIDAASVVGGGVVSIPLGRFRTTDELVIKQNVRLVGAIAPFYQTTPGDAPGIGEVSHIYYDGGGGSNSAVIRASTAAVGTKLAFTNPNTTTLLGAGVEHLYIDGNNLAEYGLYVNRAGLGCRYTDLVCANTKEHGAWFGDAWTTRVSQIYAIHNYGRGISIGSDDFSWAGDNVVNACHFDSLQGFGNGRDGTFDKTAALTDGCGIYCRPTRTCVFTNLVGEQNDGVGVILAPRAGPNLWNGIYVESNDATTNVGLVFQGQTGGVSVQALVNNIFGNTSQSLFITGTVPATNDGPRFSGVYGISGVDAAWTNYRLRDVQVVVARTMSTAFFPNNEAVVETPAALGAGNNNNLATISVLATTARLAINAGGSTLTGMTGGITGLDGSSSGRRVRLLKISGGTFTIAHLNGNSTAANQFITPTGAGITVGTFADCEYDSTTAAWRVTAFV